MSKKYIRVDNPRPHLALQAFAVAIEQAVKEGYTISGDPTHHARELNSGCYDITVVLPEVSRFGEGSHGLPLPLSHADFVRTMEQRPQPETTITSTAAPEDEPVFVTTIPGNDNPILAHLESCKNKQDLLDFAQRHGIVVPEDKQVFTAVKKYIKEQLTPKTV